MNRMSRFYRIADIVIETVFDKEWYMPSQGVLEPFVCETTASDYIVECKLVDELPYKAGNIVYYDARKHVKLSEDGFLRCYGHPKNLDECYACTIRNGNRIDAFVKRSVLVDGIPSHLMAELLELEHLLAIHHGVLLHASVINVNGEAVLFTAPSQTGKSTQASLWERYAAAEIINGDRCAVMIENEGIFVHGIPFAGSSGIRKNIKLPIKAIVYLKQAQENYAEIYRCSAAFRRVYEGCSVQLWDELDVQTVIDTVSKIVENVPVIQFECRPDEEAVNVLKKKLEELSCEK